MQLSEGGVLRLSVITTLSLLSGACIALIVSFRRNISHASLAQRADHRLSTYRNHLHLGRTGEVLDMPNLTLLCCGTEVPTFRMKSWSANAEPLARFLSPPSQAGVQIGNSAWELYCVEHGLNPEGRVVE